MNQEIKKQWVEALRSGKYQQGQYKLRNNDNEFCCLGVLCDIYSKENDVAWDNTDSTYFTGSGYKMLGENNYLPYTVAQWCGLPNEIELVDIVDDQIEYKNFIGLNDVEKWNFNQIADIIEKNL